MIRHVVLLKWKRPVSDEEVAVLDAALATLPAAIPQIARYRFGSDAGLADGNHDYALIADFADRDAYLAYAAHPAHQRVVAERIRPLVGARAAVQIELDDT